MGVLHRPPTSLFTPPPNPSPARTRRVHLDAPGQWHRATAPSPGRPTPGVVKQDKSSGGSIDTTKTRSGPQSVRMCSGERPIGAAKGTQSDTEALCQPPNPPTPNPQVIGPNFSPGPSANQKCSPVPLAPRKPHTTGAGGAGGGRGHPDPPPKPTSEGTPVSPPRRTPPSRSAPGPCPPPPPPHPPFAPGRHDAEHLLPAQPRVLRGPPLQHRELALRQCPRRQLRVGPPHARGPGGGAAPGALDWPRPPSSAGLCTGAVPTRAWASAQESRLQRTQGPPPPPGPRESLERGGGPPSPPHNTPALTPPQRHSPAPTPAPNRIYNRQ